MHAIHKKLLRKRRKIRAKTPGQAPGSLVYVGEQRTEKVHFWIIDYSSDALEETDLQRIKDIEKYKTGETVSWINIEGLHDTAVIAELGKIFSLHPLLLEDVVNTQQRPKVESFEEHLFIVLKMLSYDSMSASVISEQVSLVLGDTYVLSFQEKEGDVFNPVRARLRHGKGRIRTSGPDYLFYALIDAVVDHYYVVLEKFGDRLERLEEEIFLNATNLTLRDIQETKLELIHLHKAVAPMREVAATMLRDDSPVIAESTQVFLRDLYDHTIQSIEIVDSQRDTSSGLLEIYLSIVSNRMNEVMKVLTIIATIFIPLTFIAGIYGMNFEYMPELAKPWAYPAVMILMLLIAVVMLIYFRKKKWI